MSASHQTSKLFTPQILYLYDHATYSSSAAAFEWPPPQQVRVRSSGGTNPHKLGSAESESESFAIFSYRVLQQL
jgi:hypothetical protein